MDLTRAIYWVAAVAVFFGILGMQQDPWAALTVFGALALIINFIGHMCDLNDKH
tara:strand:+ start:1134 stop:1295 length:162 start_codon:yes stop_codon:yes gene_type:complete